MPQHSTRRMMALAIGMGLSLGWAGGARAAGFNSGSTGADGALNVTTNTVLAMPANGVFNFTTVTIASGATLSFKKNVTNTPVVLLATGDVNIAGTIDVSGGNSAGNKPGILGDASLPGVGGPGGFDGGRGGVPANSRRAGNGLGPGGGAGGNGVANCCSSWLNHAQGGGGGGHANTGAGNRFMEFGSNAANTGVAGPAYGSNLLIPLTGGAGGGGGAGSASTTGAYGTGGGGGGGALLLASSGTVTVAGTIKATGGNSGATSSCDLSTTCGGSGGGGSGGAVRILATAIAGTGNVNVAGGAPGDSPVSSVVNGGAGSIGRVRYDVMSAGTLTLSGLPTLTITSVAGIAAPANPTGLQDIVLPEGTPNPVTVTLATTGVPAGNVVTLTLTPKRGAATTATSSALAGSTAGATATASIDVPTDISTLSAAVTYTVTVAMGEALSNYAGNERVEKVRLSASLGSRPRAMLVTASGREYEAPEAALLMAGIAQ